MSNTPTSGVYDPKRLEAETARFWRARGLPPDSGVLGPPDGTLVHGFEGTSTTGESSASTLARAVAADVMARYRAQVGRRAVATWRWEADGTVDTVPPAGALLQRMGVWVGGAKRTPWDSDVRHGRIEQMVGRLAHRGIVVTRDLPLRLCPRCAEPRNPERIIYQEEEGDTYLVRFEVTVGDRSVQALVWSDAPWRLLGTSALLLHPQLPYVVANFRHRDTQELILTSRSSLERFRSWIPGASIDVQEEGPGQRFEGLAYRYPLRHEFPHGGGLTAPGGTIVAVPDVTDTGTGIVPLVPGHGSTDALIAEQRGIPGWPLLTPRGFLDFTLVHKYAGLDLRTADEFVVRDLSESGALFAHLKVRRGVPHCRTCGSPLVWAPGRAWCLEPGRLPAERTDLYRRLLPRAPPITLVEVAPWPLSETTTSTDASAVALLECSRCERLDSLDGSPSCACGEKKYPTRRKLLPCPRGALAAWAQYDPFPPTDSVRFFLGERRLVPALIHQLTAMTGADASSTDVALAVLPTIPEIDVAALAESVGADAVRSALVCTESHDRASTVVARATQERGRLARLWALSEEVVARCDPALLATFGQPVAGSLTELEPEDRALLARWERTRSRCLAAYDRGSPAAAHRRLFRFLETDLAEYRDWVGPRLNQPGTPNSKRSALRVLVHVLNAASAILAPIAPFVAETVRRRISSDRASVFERPLEAADRALLDDELATAWDRWRTVVRAVQLFRRSRGLPPNTPIPSAALVLARDDEALRFRSERPILERLSRVERLDLGSPQEPWTGRHRRLEPIESEIQKAYPSQASQILHVLRHMPPRRAGDGGSAADLSVVIQGLPRQILPSMVEYVDTIPESMVPFPWSRGELYLEIPVAAARTRSNPPPLGVDAFWLLRRLQRRLTAAPSPPPDRGWVAVVSAPDPLASELRTFAEPVARYLGLAEFRVADRVAEAGPEGRISGRTRSGARWWVDVPGLPARRSRRKPRPPRSSGPRIPTPPLGTSTPEVDFADATVIAHEQAVRALGQELDSILGAPVIGPAKVRAAWELGYQNVQNFRDAPYENLVELPGFGWGLATALVVGLGRTPPAPVPRSMREGRPPLRVRREEPGAGRSADLRASTPRPPSLPAAAPPASAPTPGVSGEERPVPSERIRPAPTTRDRPAQLRPLVRPAETPTDHEAPAGPGTPPTGTTERTPSLGPAVRPGIPRSETPLAGPPTVPEGGPAPGAPVEAPAVEAELQSESAVAPSETGGPLPGDVGQERNDVAAIPPELEAPGSSPTSGNTEVGRPTEAPAPSPSAIEPEAGELPEEPAGTSSLHVTEPPTVSPPTEPAGPTDRERAASVSVTQASGGPPASPSTGPAEAPSSRASNALPSPTSTGPSPTPLEVVPPSSGVAPNVPSPSTPSTFVGRETEVSSRPALSPPPSPAEPPAPPSSTLPSVLPPQALPPVPEPPPPPPGGIDVAVGDSLVASLQPFLEATAAGLRGICLVRESPERIGAHVGQRPVEVYWLTNLGRGHTLKPNDLTGLTQFLAHALRDEHVAVFFLEGVEYLIRIHGVDPVLQHLVEFDRLAREREARVWLHITPDLLAPNDLARVVAAFPPRR